MKIPVAKPALIGKEREYVLDCIDTEWISSNGKYIAKFEESFCKYIDVKHSLTCSNGTVALHLPLLAMGIGPGDEVIVPTLTYIATANAVKYVGAELVLADSDLNSWNITADLIRPKITSKTKAIIIVHLYGLPVDMDPIMKLAEEFGLYVIEDCAESLGATYKGRQTGSIGHVGTFSFFGNKTITTGEGGMVTTNDDKLAAQMRLLKGQGMDPNRRYWHPIVGYNYRMTNIQAAIGLAQLEQVQWHLDQRTRIAKTYDRLISDSGISVRTQACNEFSTHSYWMYTVVLDNGGAERRDKVMQLMAELGVETRPVFYNMHVMPPHRQDCVFKNAELISCLGINLPTFSQLTDEQVAYVVSALKKSVG
nr:GDP-perosamine synthase [Bdellovibrio sp. HM001]